MAVAVGANTTSAPVVASPSVPLPVGSQPKTGWTFAYGPWNSLPNAELPTLTGRSVTWRLVGNHEASFTVDGTLPEVAGIQELISDLWFYRNGLPIYRGRFGSSSDTLDGTSHSVSFASADYRALLKRRILFDSDTLTYTNRDLSDVAWNMITQSQAKPGGSWGIVRGQGTSTGIVQSPVFTAGSDVAAMVDQLAQGVPGFEWDVQPLSGSTALTFDIWPGQRGIDRQKVLDYPGRVQSATRSVDPSAFANALRVTGGTPPTPAGSTTSPAALAPVVVTESGIASDPAGRFDGQFGDTNIVTAATLNAKAAYELALMQQVAPVWTVTLNPDSWGGPGDIWLGDPIILAVRSGRLNVVGSLRVQELKLALDDNTDAATVTLTMSTATPQKRWALRAFNQRLTALEKR